MTSTWKKRTSKKEAVGTAKNVGHQCEQDVQEVKDFLAHVMNTYRENWGIA
jgi:hypothetical protein